MEPFQPQVLSPEEIVAMLTEVSEQEVEQARSRSLTQLKRQILYQGLPASAVILRLDLPGRARRLGEAATARLRHMQEEHSLIGDVRGPGLFIGVELVEDRQSKVPATERATALVELASKQGVILDLDLPDIVDNTVTRRNVVKIKPPLTISEERLDKALDIFERSLAAVSSLPAEQLQQIRQQMMAEAIPR